MREKFLSVKVIIKFDQTKESRKLNSTRRAPSNIIMIRANTICDGLGSNGAGERERDLGITILFISVFK